MKTIHRSLAASVLRGCAIFLGMSAITHADILYVGDGADNTVKRFDARTAAYLGPLVPAQGDGLLGPMGMLRKGKDILVVNQNLGQPFNGEVLRFNRRTGEFGGALIACQETLHRPCDPDSPFTPRGMIKGPGSNLFLADLLGASFTFDTEGSLKQYDFSTGRFIRNLDTTGFNAGFHPRGVVIGPDGKLYVSVVGVLDPDLAGFDPLAGYVLRFDPNTGNFLDIFASFQPNSSDCSRHLHRPEGLSFGPNGKLYITSFRADPGDIDRILVFSKGGECVDQIDLYPAGQPRAFSQAIIFGPRARLFVPINNTGEIRRYNVRTGRYDSFVPAGGPLLNPWYLTFGNTDPKSLEYDD